MEGCKHGRDMVTLNQVTDVVSHQKPLPTWKWQEKLRDSAAGCGTWQLHQHPHCSAGETEAQGRLLAHLWEWDE